MFDGKNKIESSANTYSGNSLAPTSFPNLLEGTFDQRTVYVEYSIKSRVPYIVIFCKSEQFPEFLESREQCLGNTLVKRSKNNITEINFKRIIDFLLTENGNIMHYLLASNNTDDILCYILKHYLCNLQYRLICKKLCAIFDQKLLAEKFLVKFWVTSELTSEFPYTVKLSAASKILRFFSGYDEENRSKAIQAQYRLMKKGLSFNLLINNFETLKNTKEHLDLYKEHLDLCKERNLSGRFVFTFLSRIEGIYFGRSSNSLHYPDQYLACDDTKELFIELQKFLNQIYKYQEKFPNLKKLTFNKFKIAATVPLNIPKFETLEVLDFKSFWDVRFDYYPNLKKLNCPVDQQFNNEHYLILDGTLRFRNNIIVNLKHNDYWRLEGLIKHLEYSKEETIQEIIIQESLNDTLSVQNFTILDLLIKIGEKRDLFKKLNRIVLKLKNENYMNVLQEEFHIVPQFKSNIEVHIEIRNSYSNSCDCFKMLHKVVSIEFSFYCSRNIIVVP